jgi:tetratricopeptide (TPR) repeat protein
VFQDIGHVENVLHYLLDENIIQTPSSPTSSPTSSQTSYTSFDSFILDPEARDQVRTSLHPEDQIDHAWLACNMCVDGIRKQELDSSSLSEIHQFGRVMAPHAKTCYDDWSSVLGMQMNDDNIAWQVLGNVCMTQGALEQAIGCFELALAQKGSMDAIERIQTSLSLVSLLNQSGEHQRSRDTLADIDIGDIDIALGFRVAMAKASAAAAQGELDRAEDQYNTLEHEQEEVLGPTDVNTVGTVQRLASTLEQLGKLDEAQALYRRVYLSYQNIFGPAHPMTLEALEDLAHISKECNAIDEAESLYHQSVDIKMRTLGTQHPSTADTLQKLAVIDDLRCRYDDAAAKYRRALDSMAPVLGRAHPLYTTTMENMALSSRWYGRSLYDSGHMGVMMSEGSPTHERTRLRSRGSSSSSDSKKSSKQTAAEREAQRQAAFETAERLYLDVLGIKTAARDLYTNEQVLATGSKLCEMYDNELYFAEHKVAKVEDVMKLLRERGKGGPTLAVGSV